MKNSSRPEGSRSPRAMPFPWRGALIVAGAMISILAWISLFLVESSIALHLTNAAIAFGLLMALVGLFLVLRQKRYAMRGLDPALADGRRVYLVPLLIGLILLSFVVSLMPLPNPLAWASTLLPIMLIGLAIWLGTRLMRSIPPQAFIRAQRDYQQGQLPEALAGLDALREQQPDYYPALHLQTVIHRQQNDCEGAYKDAEKLISLRPDLYYGHAELGLTLLEDGQPERAAEPLRRATELAPALPEGHFNLGLARLEAQDHRGAIESLSRALRLGLADPVARLMAHHGLYVSYQAIGNKEQEKHEWQRLWRERGLLKQWRNDLATRPGSAASRRKEQAVLATIERAITRPPA